jgi:hypothetical protein
MASSRSSDFLVELAMNASIRLAVGLVVGEVAQRIAPASSPKRGLLKDHSPDAEMFGRALPYRRSRLA